MVSDPKTRSWELRRESDGMVVRTCAVNGDAAPEASGIAPGVPVRWYRDGAPQGESFTFSFRDVPADVLGPGPRRLPWADDPISEATYEWRALAMYNAEVSRGIVHTPEYRDRMAAAQAAFDAAQLVEFEARGGSRHLADDGTEWWISPGLTYAEGRGHWARLRAWLRG